MLRASLKQVDDWIMGNQNSSGEFLTLFKFFHICIQTPASKEVSHLCAQDIYLFENHNSNLDSRWKPLMSILMYPFSTENKLKLSLFICFSNSVDAI